MPPKRHKRPRTTATQKGAECKGARVMMANELAITPIPMTIRTMPKRNLANPFMWVFYIWDNIVSIVMIDKRDY